jgi:hypothetical protein
LLFPGPVSGQQVWTEEDWVFFSENRVDLFLTVQPGRESLSDFASEIRRLGQWYSPGEEEQFVWAIALLYAGIPYGTTRGGVVSQGFGASHIVVPECEGQRLICAWLTHGMEDFSAQVASSAENTHHYAGHLLAGYYWGWVANGATELREWAQGIGSGEGTDQLDVNMGRVATAHGRGLADGTLSPWNLSGYLLRDLAPSPFYLPAALREDVR